ncbi:MAG: nucleotidyl transferase AbiEii/AbiGii toxin family protein [Candidatus Shapirobacteria bacterium]
MRKLHPQTIPAKTKDLISLFQKGQPEFLKKFYLSGGTALSLQFGHRESVDLDFFTQSDFNPRTLQSKLEKYGQLKDLQLGENTLNAFLRGAQIQFLGYHYPLLKPVVNWKNIPISSVIDIACTKLQTIGMRGSKKGFLVVLIFLNH